MGESLEEKGKKCCKSKKSKNGQVIDTGLSQIHLGVVSADKKDRGLTRHERGSGSRRSSTVPGGLSTLRGFTTTSSTTSSSIKVLEAPLRKEVIGWRQERGKRSPTDCVEGN